MTRVKSKVNLNRQAIKRLDQAAIRALEMSAEALHTDVVQAGVMPRLTGDLQNTSTFVDFTESQKGRVSLVTTAPQARRLYFHPEYQFTTTENTNAGGKWYDEWTNGANKKFASEAFAKFFARNGGV